MGEEQFHVNRVLWFTVQGWAVPQSHSPCLWWLVMVGAENSHLVSQEWESKQLTELEHSYSTSPWNHPLFPLLSASAMIHGPSVSPSFLMSLGQLFILSHEQFRVRCQHLNTSLSLGRQTCAVQA